MEIKVVKESLTRDDLRKMASEQYGYLVKAAVDIQQEIMALGGEMHMDEEMLLIEQEGSSHEHVWGINLYPEKAGEEFVEFDSMINLKPAFGNRTRSVESPEAREKIKAIVHKLIIS